MSRPIFYFDDSCPLCRRWATRFKQWTGAQVEYRAFAEPETKSSTEYHDEAGKISYGAESVAQLLSHTRWGGWVFSLYQSCRPFVVASEWFYRRVSTCRECVDKAIPLVIILICLFVFLAIFLVTLQFLA